MHLVQLELPDKFRAIKELIVGFSMGVGAFGPLKRSDHSPKYQTKIITVTFSIIN